MYDLELPKSDKYAIYLSSIFNPPNPIEFSEDMLTILFHCGKYILDVTCYINYDNQPIDFNNDYSIKFVSSDWTKIYDIYTTTSFDEMIKVVRKLTNKYIQLSPQEINNLPFTLDEYAQN